MSGPSWSVEIELLEFTLNFFYAKTINKIQMHNPIKKIWKGMTEIEREEKSFCNLRACWIGLDEQKTIQMHNPINKIGNKVIENLIRLK